jgi:transcription initiation factor IIE alpha subunit
LSIELSQIVGYRLATLARILTALRHKRLVEISSSCTSRAICVLGR